MAKLTYLANIAPWFCLRLPSCGPRFESQAQHLRFFQFVLNCVVWKRNCNEIRTKLNKKETGIGPFLTYLANIAPLFRCIASCGPGFKSKTYHLRFFNLFMGWNWKCVCNWLGRGQRQTKKRPGLAHFKKYFSAVFKIGSSVAFLFVFVFFKQQIQFCSLGLKFWNLTDKISRFLYYHLNASLN